jgi:hypothetical protein
MARRKLARETDVWMSVNWSPWCASKIQDRSKAAPAAVLA